MASALSLPVAAHATTMTGAIPGLIGTIVRALPGVAEVERLYAASHHRPEGRFADRALAVLEVVPQLAGAFDAIPRTGPLIVVANHPTGALDGLVMSSMLCSRRSDVKLLANHWLDRVTAMSDELLLVDAFGDGRCTNGTPLRAAVRWVRNGGALCIFPAGAVSHFQPGLLATVDPQWRDGVGRLIRLTSAAVVPCHIDGRNSALFQAAGVLHPWLRTALLPRELLRRRRSRMVVRIGRPLDAGEYRGTGDAEIVERLRAIVYDLPEAIDREQVGVTVSIPPAVSLAPVAQALAAAQGLVETNEYSVFWMTARQAPDLLDEIGRQREAAFRAAGEGTGNQVDLDRFDADYIHLVLWDRQTQTLAGAYRMRPVSADLPAGALYTSTLFDFDQRLVRALSPGLELGRAFVAPAHQKRHAPLMLLWMGIARYVAAHPTTTHLFGAVSIGANYSPMARAFMAAYLKRHAVDRLRAPLVSPRHPLMQTDGDVAGGDGPRLDPQALSTRVEALDVEGKGLPVLLRQYLKLNAQVLDFSVDPAFSNVLDALVTIDLPAAPRALLKRYMGEAAADAYLASHWRGDRATA